MTDGKSKKEQPTKTSAAGTLALPDPTKPFAEQDPDILLAMCLYGEARGESEAARRAVAQVVLNRAKFPHRVFGSRAGADIAENLRRVILKPRQFSCFLPDDPNYPQLLRPLDYESAPVWERCLRCAQEALAAADAEDCCTAHSDHYFDDSLQPPSWADPAKQTVSIGRLRFYRLYLPAPQTGSLAAVPPPFPPTRPHPEPVLPRLGEGGQKASGAGSRSTSSPAPHPPKQRTPRLGPNRWLKRGRGLSSLVAQAGRLGGRSNREWAKRHQYGVSGSGEWPRALFPIRYCLLPLLMISLCLVLTACSDLERQAYRTLATTRVEYEAVRRHVVEAVLHDLLTQEQWDRFAVSGHSFLEAHQDAVEAFVVWSQTQSKGDAARLAASLDALPRLLHELTALVQSFEEPPREDRRQESGVSGSHGRSHLPWACFRSVPTAHGTEKRAVATNSLERIHLTP